MPPSQQSHDDFLSAQPASPSSRKKEIIIRQLEVHLIDLRKELVITGEALAALRDDEATHKAAVYPRNRAHLLRDYLLAHPGAIQTKDVPRVLAAVGHVSRQPNPQVSWLYQNPDAQRFFVIKRGRVMLRETADNCQKENPAAPLEVSKVS